MADQKASILMGATFVVFTIAIGQARGGAMPHALLALAGFSFLSAMCAVAAVLPSISGTGAIQRPDGLMQALDQINARHGRGKARLGLAGQDARWLMRQENLSPSYTTRWSDIPEASMGHHSLLLREALRLCDENGSNNWLGHSTAKCNGQVNLLRLTRSGWGEHHPDPRGCGKRHRVIKAP